VHLRDGVRIVTNDGGRLDASAQRQHIAGRIRDGVGIAGWYRPPMLEMVDHQAIAETEVRRHFLIESESLLMISTPAEENLFAVWEGEEQPVLRLATTDASQAISLRARILAVMYPDSDLQTETIVRVEPITNDGVLRYNRNEKLDMPVAVNDYTADEMAEIMGI
jgi:hypothetical protein